MTWYKESQFKIENFEDRNIINSKIRHLEDVSSTLKYASDLVYQTQRGARGIVKVLLSDKILSSFTEIQKILSAADYVALDSPKKFAEFCLKASEQVERKVGKLKADRKKATKEGLPKKGLF